MATCSMPTVVVPHRVCRCLRCSPGTCAAYWSLANLAAVTAEASEPTFAVGDAFFTEYWFEPTDEPLYDGGGLLLQLVAAVDYFQRGPRTGFTVWDAIDEALRWHGDIETDWADADPLLRTLRLSFMSNRSESAAATFNAAIRHWITAARTFNDSIPWELSASRL